MSRKIVMLISRSTVNNWPLLAPLAQRIKRGVVRCVVLGAVFGVVLGVVRVLFSPIVLREV